ncbi:hypothetical protein MKEN_00983600 [Mycena kentingensis (nom. inval.)]|nr:hypothetical protein MKEN_00983600 [Mycena kentingensis (nom. inval.)]
MPTDPSTQAAVTTFARYLRTASLAIAAYDYLQTLPFEVRICREAWRNRRMSSSFIFFILIRYTSIFVLTISNVAYFGSTFTRSICGHFFLLPSVFKLLQAMVSQAILGFRAYNLSRKSRPMGLFLLFVFVLCITASAAIFSRCLWAEISNSLNLLQRCISEQAGVMFKPELKK